jgi:hypothetical protein
VIFECDEDLLDENENRFIEEHNSLWPNGYNLKTVGTTCRYSEDSKKKMSDSQKELYKNSEKMREQIKMNGFKNKKNKSLPMYMTEEYNGNHELIGYRIYRHPANPKGKKFCNKSNLPEAYERAMQYLSSLNLQDKE